MAAKDAVTKDYMRNPAVFADAFNFLLYGGRSVINPEKLHDLDTVEIVLPYGEDGTVAPTLVVLFSPEPWDGPMSIHGMLSGVEKEILPFIADYRINLIAPAALDEASMDRFQSSLREVLLFITLSGQGDTRPKYRLLAAGGVNVQGTGTRRTGRTLSDSNAVESQICGAKPSGPLFTEGKYSTDKKQLKRLLDTDTHYQAMGLDAATVINTVTNTKLKLKKKEGKVNMCLAIEEMCRESRLEGEKKGQKKGEKLGEKKGEKRGRQTGIRLINELNGILIERNRIDDLKRAAREPEYQARLIEELLPDSISII